MKQLSSLTKIMFCIVAILLIITVVLGIATAVKDSKENRENKGTSTTVSPAPDSGITDTPGLTDTPDDPDTTPSPEATKPPVENTPAPTATSTPVPATPTPVATGKHVVAIDPGQQKSAMTDDEPIGPGSSTKVDKMSYGATSLTTSKREHEWTLALSKKLKAELEARGYEVVMTREKADVKLSNAERAQAVNASEAEIYISIQADAAGNASANGIYAQIPSKNNEFVKALHNDSKALANAIHKKLIAETGAYDRGVQEADKLATINYSEIPVTILQLGYMTNKDEDTKLWTEEYQNKLVKAICDGIDAYFED